MRTVSKSSQSIWQVIPAIGLTLLSAGFFSSSGYAQALVGTVADFTLRCSVSRATGATATRAFPATDAIPDGKTDDYDAIQTAINDASAAGGGVVILPRGTFIINGHLTMQNNVKLQGAGRQTIIKAGPLFLQTTGPFGGYPVITTNGSSNITIANLTADQSGDTLDVNVSGRLNEYLVDIRYSTNAIVDGIYTRNPFTYSIAAVASSVFCIKDSSTQVTSSGKYNQLDGIHILNSSYGDVINNNVDQGIGTDGDDGLVAHTIDGSVHDVRYADNKVRGGSNGSAMQLAYTSSSDEIYNLLIQNNDFWGSPEGIHTGDYPGAGTTSYITIGGSPATGNCFNDNGGNAVDFSGPLNDVDVSYNIAHNSGAFIIGPGKGNVVRDNTMRPEPCGTVR